MKGVFLGLLLTGTVLLVYLLWNKPVTRYDDQPYKDSILVLKRLSDSLSQASDSILLENIKLKSRREAIRIIYRDKYILIKGEDIHQLDSTIRSAIQ